MSTDTSKQQARACLAHADTSNLEVRRAAIASDAAIQVNGDPEMTTAAAAARAASLSAPDVTALGRAGFLHDIGHIGVQSKLPARTGALP
jgi:response regulator RpfG family c-di-GMP phosphodiesterase